MYYPNKKQIILTFILKMELHLNKLNRKSTFLLIKYNKRWLLLGYTQIIKQKNQHYYQYNSVKHNQMGTN
ncbi:hypothetical protein D6200_13265 [Tenacibaculum mesophilum]|uniref:Uncharacterized protein n=1 Tax=Tenacibaculum mesophilum TaxID=104268 RepID=A0ABM7CI99_9FLAO|nr:hypothetical protein D6200_13265 [Tenacibaculum mesophilum]